MPTPPLADEVLIEAVALRNEHKTLQDAANAAGISWHSFNNRLTRAAERGLDGSVPRAVPLGQRIKGVSTLYNAAGDVAAQWVKTDRDKLDPAEIVEQIREALAEYDGTAEPTPAPVADNALATIFPVVDAHFGLMTWKQESGHDYDLKIAEKTIRDSMSRLFEASPASSTAVILGLGDLLHSDGYEPVTKRSRNVLDVDSRYPKILKTATTLLVWMIDRALEKHGQVLVRILPGNHDDQSAIAVSLALSMRYSSHPRVTVDDDPSRFWYWSWGATLLGATHGDMAKMADLPGLMAQQRPKEWGASKFRAVYTGHIHHQSAIEKLGVVVESFQTTAVPDAWHAGMGYGSGRSVVSITHCRERGEISRARVNVR
ncbi:hypothetical protein [Aurantimonas coralicida]|uniref:hypothetical protein n=1 Tax=Aurantimonas coralicida TaxID=182270 RepID=UPI001E47E1B9|nr:hypothetical protein [Aurantimonas coralicida]MCD1644176.1 hypothetical protein [Aurantimonas coralicida]